MTSDELRKAAYEVEATGFPLVGLNYRQSAVEEAMTLPVWTRRASK